MDEILQLRQALRSARPEDWVTAAAVALDESDVRFCGKSDAATEAASLVRIYGIRLSRCRERGIRCIGMDALLDTLRELPGSAPVFVKPFLGNARVVGAFWDASGRLLGCITGPASSPDDILEDNKCAQPNRLGY